MIEVADEVGKGRMCSNFQLEVFAAPEMLVGSSYAEVEPGPRFVNSFRDGEVLVGIGETVQGFEVLRFVERGKLLRLSMKTEYGGMETGRNNATK